MTTEFIFIDRYYYCDDKKVMGVSSEYSNKKAKEIYLKYCKDNPSYYEIKNISNKSIISKMTIKKVNKPTTYPKFSNEISFKIKWNKGFILQPLIEKIRWNGFVWEYQLKNIGHLYDFIEEFRLIKIKS